MNSRVPHRITRGYAVGVLAADAFFALSLLVMAWGFLSLGLETSPVTTQISNLVAPALVVVCLAFLVVLLWRELMNLLRGNRPSWALAIIAPGLAYLVWSLIGMAFSLTVSETWLSPFAFSLAGAWLIAVLVFWWIIMRKLYTGKGRPLWPWERNGLDEGPDWFRDGPP